MPEMENVSNVFTIPPEITANTVVMDIMAQLKFKIVDVRLNLTFIHK
jgi:hypothetical protein